MEDIINWWKTLWTDYKPVATAIAGFISALLIFIIKDAIWQSRVTRNQKREDFQQKRLDCFYSPLYLFYRESYARFDFWRNQNPESILTNRPFFETKDAEILVEKLFAEQSSYSSKELIGLWTNFKAIDDKTEKNRRRFLFVENLIKEYNGIRKELHLDYSENEILSGKFE